MGCLGLTGNRLSVLEARLGRSLEQALQLFKAELRFLSLPVQVPGCLFYLQHSFSSLPLRVYQGGSKKKSLCQDAQCRGGWPAPCSSAPLASAAPKLMGGPTVEEPQESVPVTPTRGSLGQLGVGRPFWRGWEGGGEHERPRQRQLTFRLGIA